VSADTRAALLTELYSGNEAMAAERRLWFDFPKRKPLADEHPRPWKVKPSTNFNLRYPETEYLVVDARGQPICSCDKPYLAEAIAAAAPTIQDALK
jgi:hypothetical protein